MQTLGERIRPLTRRDTVSFMRDKEELTAEKVVEIEAKGINFDDIPELIEEDFDRGHFKNKNLPK